MFIGHFGVGLGALVVSHWVLDLLVHSHHLPIITGLDVKIGLGLWNSFALTLIVELTILQMVLSFICRLKKRKIRKEIMGYED